MDDYRENDGTPEYPACIGCPQNTDTADGLCSAPGPCQAYQGIYEDEESLNEPAPVELLMLPPAVTTDNGRLFDNAA